MEKILKELKWALTWQFIGIICGLVAWFMPLKPDTKTWLFICSLVLIFAYIVRIYVLVLKPLKSGELKISAKQ